MGLWMRGAGSLWYKRHHSNSSEKSSISRWTTIKTRTYHISSYFVISALPQILVTSVSNHTRETPDWAPEIPFESLARPEEIEVELGSHSLDEELNNLMDISIEIESNKVMKADYIDSWTVSLRNAEMMEEYSRQTDQTYRSSIFSLTVLWILVFLREGII